MIIKFLQNISPAVWISSISLLISSSLAIERWLSYKTNAEILMVQITDLSNISFYMHFYVTNKSSRVLSVYNLKLNSFHLNKHHHRFIRVDKDPDRDVWTSTFPINIGPWEQREFLIEMILDKDKKQLMDELTKNNVITLQTNRKDLNLEIDLKTNIIELKQATKEW